MLRWIKFFFVFLIIFLLSFFSKELEKNKRLNSSTESYEIKKIQKVFKNARYLSDDNLENNFSFIYNEKKEILGKYLKTMPYCKSIRGYAGKLPFLIVFDTKDKIKSLILGNHYETPSFIRRLNRIKYFEKWNGLSIEEAKNKDLDLIAGVTYTSFAISKSIKQRLELFSNEKAMEKKEVNLKKVTFNIFALIFLSFALFSFFKAKYRKYRTYLLLCSIIILGFLNGEFISIYLIEQGVKNSFNFYTISFLLLILTIILFLLKGENFYCNYVCPYGSSQELLGKIKIKKLKIGKKLYLKLRWIRKISLFLAGVFILLGKTAIISNMEPFSVFLLRSSTKITIILAVLFLIMSIFIQKPWCNYFCPTGQLLDIFKDKKKK